MALNPAVLEVCVVCLGIFLLLVDSFWTGLDKRGLAYAGVVGLGSLFVLSFFVQTGPLPPESALAGLYVADPLAMYFKQFALLSTIIVLILGAEYAPVVERYIPGSKPGAGVGEFFILPIFACAGLMWMVSAIDFIMIFVALELVTIAFYVMVAYMRKSVGGLEAGTKYLILGALSTGFLVYGITWIFGVTGQTNLRMIGEVLPILPVSAQMAFLFGAGLVLVALGFKIAAAPFQFWVPDVYQGAPTPVTAFLSVGSKAAGFIILLRILEPMLVVEAIQTKLLTALGILTALTLIYGNLAAMPQTNMKRLLSYSSIGHAGYLLLGVVSVGAFLSGQAIVIYLTAYLFMTFLAFGVMQIVAQNTGGDDIANFNGLAKRSPFLAFGMLVAMLSLAGIPFTAGFIGKFMIFAVALDQQHYFLIGIGVLTVACGFYYYLKVVRAMYWQPVTGEVGEIQISPLTKVTLALLMILIFVFGVYPHPLLALLQ